MFTGRQNENNSRQIARTERADQPQPSCFAPGDATEFNHPAGFSYLSSCKLHQIYNCPLQKRDGKITKATLFYK